MIAAVGEGASPRWIATRTHRRLLNALGVVIVAGLMGYALYAQHVLGLEPCPLCIFQRIAMIGLGFVFLAGALHAPVGLGARAYAGLGLVVAAVGIGIAARHVYLQNLPPDAIPACGPGLGYIFDAFPVLEALRMVFTGSGECAEVNWSFLGLSMPAWVLIWFVILGALAVAANWRRVAR
ncbi:MAG TPA: disulfide bond formation protein B [Gammaproteobacteria bacterium]